MDYYKCEKCGKRFDEFEMNFKLAQIDKKCWCAECRKLANEITEKHHKSICLEQANRFFDIIKNESYTDLEVKLYYIMALLWDEYIGINKAYELCEECGIFKSSHLEISFRYGEKYGKNI